jgi:phospholipid/cholesterol/gamma-HCH transport system ATP-binding protein
VRNDKNMIKVNNLTVKFDEQIILENISTEFAENKITVVAGKSGSGKSVLMKTILGLIVPVKGKIILDGDDVFALKKTQLNKVRRKTAMLFQGAALLDSLNVYQNVSLPLFEHSKLSEKEIAEVVSEKLELVGLMDVLKKMPSELSGGMKKRVALARAIIMQPKYIIYDEPTTGLDPNISREIINLILKLHNELDITSLVITHDLECIARTAENVKMISDKKIVFDGTYTVFKTTEQREIADFFGRE